MKEEEIVQLLQTLGYKPQETKIYLACLQSGISPVSTIAIKAGIQRTEAYLILEKLHEAGIVSFVEQNGVKHYSTISLEKFKKIQLEKVKKFEAFIPELKVLEKVSGRPKVQFFEGREGIKLALDDTLNQPRGSEILAYFTGEGYYQDDPDFAKRYVERRVKKGIKVRMIGADTPATREWTQHDKVQLRTTTRLVPAAKFPFTNEYDIYGNKVAIISLQDELLAVIIESESIVKTQRAIFELAWEAAGKYSK